MTASMSTGLISSEAPLTRAAAKPMRGESGGVVVPRLRSVRPHNQYAPSSVLSGTSGPSRSGGNTNELFSSVLSTVSSLQTLLSQLQSIESGVASQTVEHLTVLTQRLQGDSDRVHALRRELDSEVRQLKVENRQVKQRLDQREQEVAQHLELELSKLKRDRMAMERQLRERDGVPDRNQRDELQRLQAQLAAQRQEMTAREARLKARLEQVTGQLAAANSHNEELRQELRIAEQVTRIV